MSGRSIDELRTELKNLGYLSHGLERWFAQDPWRSRTFWTELLLISAKAALVIALFGTAALTAVMIFRNGAILPLEITFLAALYFIFCFTCVLLLHVALALLLKIRPVLGVENPRILIAVAMALAGFLALSLAAWWSAFPTSPAATEAVIFLGILVLLFAATSILTSAALLSFSIHETMQIPRIHRKPRTLPLLAGAILLLLLILGGFGTDLRTGTLPETAAQIVVHPSTARVALIAVDGLTTDLFDLRQDLKSLVGEFRPAAVPDAISAPELWATVGSGTLAHLHGVRAVEGVSLPGGTSVLQKVSPLDVVLRHLAPAFGLARRQPLPPSIRNRHYVWESMAKRGVAAAAVNWWTSESDEGPLLLSVGQEAIFDEASRRATSPVELALAIDAAAAGRFLEAADQRSPRLATVYLPALDVLLNRIPLGDRERFAATTRALEQLAELLRELDSRGWPIIVAGAPGAGTDGAGILATTTIPLALEDAALVDLAPTLLALFGFPASNEMPGGTLVSPTSPAIPSYGPRVSDAPVEVDREYYESLRSLGYIR
jgi:hypothetical protein